MNIRDRVLVIGIVYNLFYTALLGTKTCSRQLVQLRRCLVSLLNLAFYAKEVDVWIIGYTISYFHHILVGLL